MEGKMKVAVMTGVHEMEIQQRDIPKPAPGEVLIKVEYVGICGSDLHYYHTGGIGDFLVQPPFVLGHEAGGVVAELGEGVTNLQVGDRVALEPGTTCGRCEFCTTGRYNLCPDVQFYATPPVDGVFQEYALHEAGKCFPLPDNVSTMEGALIEPLAVGFYAAITGGAMIGQTAVVTGAGCIGLVSLLALKAMGVTKVYVTDVVPSRLNKALELGATGVINAGEEDVAKKILEVTGGAGCDLVIDAAGNRSTITAAIAMTKKGGTIVLVGYGGDGDIPLPVSDILNKELTIKSIFRYRHIYPLAIEAVASGQVNLKDIVTNVFTLDEAKEAMEKNIKDKNEVIKAVIKVADD